MKKIFPTVSLYTQVRNPAWTGTQGMSSYYMEQVSADVISISFNTNKMKIRYKEVDGKVMIRTVDAYSFFEKYKIELKSP